MHMRLHSKKYASLFHVHEQYSPGLFSFYLLPGLEATLTYSQVSFHFSHHFCKQKHKEKNKDSLGQVFGLASIIV